MKFNKEQSSRRNFLRTGAFALPFVFIPKGISRALVKEQLICRTAFAMGTTVSVQAYHYDRALSINAISKAFEELHRLDDLLSVYKSDSAISQINSSAGKKLVSVHDDVMNICLRSIEYARITHGIFDCTIEPLMKLWGFRDTKLQQIPTDREIDTRLNSIGYKNIVLSSKDNSVGLLNKDSAIDLGGIAVGFTVDRMRTILKREGIESALINHSGDIYALGSPPDSDGWNVAIPSPVNKDEFVHTFQIKDKALSTSGSYEKHSIIDNMKFGHILNAITGKPERNNLSVSVLTNNSIDADVFSTAFFSKPQNEINASLLQKSSEIFIVNNEMKLKHIF